MTKIIETVMVEVRCAVWTSTMGLPMPLAQCTKTAQATIVSTVERGDLVLMPIGWGTEPAAGNIEAICPDHSKKEAV